MIISREATDEYIVETYSNGTVVKNIKPETLEKTPQEPKKTQLDIIQENTEKLLANESALDVLLGVSE